MRAMLYRSFFVAIWLIAGVAVQAALPVAIPAADGDSSATLPSLADMLERANPAVVNIATRSTVVEHNRLRHIGLRTADLGAISFIDHTESHDVQVRTVERAG